MERFCGQIALVLQGGADMRRVPGERPGGHFRDTTDGVIIRGATS